MSKFQSFHINICAKVIYIRRDKDESTYWTLELRCLSWPTAPILIAHSQRELEERRTYNLTGRLCLDPGRQWTQTRLIIDTCYEIYTGSLAYESRLDAGDTRPTELDSKASFEVVAEVFRVYDDYIVISWQTYDDFERAMYGQSAIVRLTKPLDQPEMYRKKTCRISGIMMSIDQTKDFVCRTITPSK